MKKPHPLITSLKRTLFGQSKEKKPVTFLHPKEKATLHVGKNTVPPPSPPPVRDSSPTWTRALTQPIQPASPVSSIDLGGNHHTSPAEKHRSDMPWDGQLIADDNQQSSPARDPISGRVLEEQPIQVTGTPLSDLFEDEPPLLSDRREEDPTMPESTSDDGLFTEDLSGLCHHPNLLMEDPLQCPERLSLTPTHENWESMTINKQENSHV